MAKPAAETTPKRRAAVSNGTPPERKVPQKWPENETVNASIQPTTLAASGSQPRPSTSASTVAMWTAAAAQPTAMKVSARRRTAEAPVSRVAASTELVCASPSRTLCVCIDDYGLQPGINAAALDLAERGRVQAIGCIVSAAAWADGATRLRHLDHRNLDLGLHLNLTEAVAGHAAQPLWSLVLRSGAHALGARQLRERIRRQFDTWEQELGRQPDFVDGHQHVHQLPQVRELLLEEIVRRPWARLPWLRRTPPRERSESWKARIIHRLGGAAMERRMIALGLRGNAALLGVYGFDADPAIYPRRLAAWLAEARHGDLLMCHPSAQAQHHDPIAAARLNEYAVLQGEEWIQIAQTLGVQFAPLSRTLGDLGHPSPGDGAH